MSFRGTITKIIASSHADVNHPRNYVSKGFIAKKGHYHLWWCSIDTRALKQKLTKSEILWTTYSFRRVVLWMQIYVVLSNEVNIGSWTVQKNKQNASTMLHDVCTRQTCSNWKYFCLWGSFMGILADEAKQFLCKIPFSKLEGIGILFYSIHLRKKGNHTDNDV